MKVTIPSPKNFKKLKSQIKRDGFSNLHILSDFDRTLTYGSIHGTKTPSVVSMLREGNYLTKGYSKKAQALFDKYHPIEVDPKIPFPRRKKAMQEWWRTHNKLLIKSGLTKTDLKNVVKNGRIKFRKGVPEFLDFLNKHNIPLIILSASGCGDIIRLFFKEIKKDYPNISYVTNKFNWDKNGKAMKVKSPTIHCLNKDETILEKIPEVYALIKNRRNVLLLGDGIGDLGMIEGFDYATLLKVGFLNFNYNEFREEYEKNFDIILEGDGDFERLNELIRGLG